MAAIAAAALGGSLFLPWWSDPLLHVSLVGVRRLSFIEVALMLVAGAVLALLLGRAERRPFHLPLSDGTLIAASGAWAFLLIVVRLLDPPTRTVGTITRDYGNRWGLFVALVSAAVLAVAGVRERRKQHRGQPESVAADEDATRTLYLP